MTGVCVPCADPVQTPTAPRVAVKRLASTLSPLAEIAGSLYLAFIFSIQSIFNYACALLKYRSNADVA